MEEVNSESIYPEKLSYSGIVVALGGIGVSIYSLMHHLAVKANGYSDFACNIDSTISCDAVALSKYSEIAGIPLGVFGIGYFLGMLVLLGIALQKPSNRREALSAYLLLTGLGVCGSVILGALSWFSLQAVCLVCVGIYVLTLLQLGIVILFRSEFKYFFAIKSLVNGLSAPGFAMIVAIVIYNFIPREPSRSPVLTVDQQRQMSKEIDQQPKLDIDISRSPYAGAGEDFRKGPDSAEIVIVEFADFECPGCRYAAEALQKIAAEFPERVQIVFKNYPLNSTCNSTMSSEMHKHACQAAFIGRCVGENGKFWDYSSLVFSSQSSLSTDKLRQIALGTGISSSDLDYCLKERESELKKKIEADVQLGQKVGVRGTPALYINGRAYSGPNSYEAISEYIRSMTL